MIMQEIKVTTKGTKNKVIFRVFTLERTDDGFISTAWLPLEESMKDRSIKKFSDRKDAEVDFLREAVSYLGVYSDNFEIEVQDFSVKKYFARF